MGELKAEVPPDCPSGFEINRWNCLNFKRRRSTFGGNGRVSEWSSGQEMGTNVKLLLKQVRSWVFEIWTLRKHHAPVYQAGVLRDWNLRLPSAEISRVTPEWDKSLANRERTGTFSTGPNPSSIHLRDHSAVFFIREGARSSNRYCRGSSPWPKHSHRKQSSQQCGQCSSCGEMVIPRSRRLVAEQFVVTAEM
jgi:hypothetical protein